MGAQTDISWTDATWNPIRGCTRVSPGCENCYAERMAARFCGKGEAYEGLAVMRNHKPRWTGKVRLIEDHLYDPIRWKRKRRIFANSTSDLFHEKLSMEDIARVWAVMLLAPHHTFQVLTKRAQRMFEILTDKRFYAKVLDAAHPIRIKWPSLTQIAISDPTRFPAPWIWLGTSVEDQQRADERVPFLLKTPSRVRFLSCEPLLGRVDLSSWMGDQNENAAGGGSVSGSARRAARGSIGRHGLEGASGETERMGRSDPGASLQATSDRHGQGGPVPDREVDAEPETGRDWSSSPSVPVLSWSDTVGNDDQSQERGQEGQPSRESRVGYLLGAGPSRAQRSREGHKESIGAEKCDGQADGGPGVGNTAPTSIGGKTGIDRSGLFDRMSDGLGNCAPKELAPLAWIIVGAESGPGARPMELDWARSLRDQCLEAGTAFFLKQVMVDGKKVETPILDGKQHVGFPSC